MAARARIVYSGVLSKRRGRSLSVDLSELFLGVAITLLQRLLKAAWWARPLLKIGH
jgi:hypothetical protein